MKRKLYSQGALMAALLTVPLAAGCSSDGRGRSTENDNQNVLGSVNLALTAGAGIIVNQLSYTVYSAGGTQVLQDSIDVTGPEEVFQVRLTLPAGTGYRIALRATTTAGRACGGEATFNVVAQQMQQVMVDLLCDGEDQGNNNGDVLINGTIGTRPPPVCPDVAFVSVAPLQAVVGRSLNLNGGATPSTGAVSTSWSASAGTIASASSAATTFTCTSAGAVTLTFTVTQGAACTDSESVQVTCVAAPASDAGQPTSDAGQPTSDAGAPDGGAGPTACQQIVSRCHELDPGTGPIHDCHELGHDGDVAACTAGLDACLSICVAPEPDAGTPDSGPSGPTDVTIQFRAEVNGAPFACGNTYTGVGTTPTLSVTPSDLRFFVQNLRLINAAGQDVPVTIATRTPWQESGVALVDFENQTGSCVNGNAATNTVITGTVPAGNYTGIAFSTSLPPDLNHADPATAPAPLRNAPGAFWVWLSGYKFMLAEMLDPATGNLGLIHLGASGCTGNAVPANGPVNVTCARPARNEIRLSAFNASSNTVVIDLGTILAGNDLAVDTQCHGGAGAPCVSGYAAIGVTASSGAAASTYPAFHVE